MFFLKLFKGLSLKNYVKVLVHNLSKIFEIKNFLINAKTLNNTSKHCYVLY